MLTLAAFGANAKRTGLKACDMGPKKRPDDKAGAEIPERQHVDD
jgi:hypothetical protein